MGAKKAGIEVHKFGGASLSDAPAFRRAVQIIKGRSGQLAVVVSAPAGVTDVLLSLAVRAAAGDGESGAAEVEALRLRYTEILRGAVSHGSIKAVAAEIDRSMEELSRLLSSLAVLKELTARTRDFIVSRGERLSAQILAAALAAAGGKARYVDATEVIFTDGPFGGASPNLMLTDLAARKTLRPLCLAGIVPVVPGFIGAAKIEEHDDDHAEGHDRAPPPRGRDDRRARGVTTLGRGGSDLTATLIGRALSAREVSLWKDVPGLLTADPRVVPDARVIPQLHLREAAELAYFGAKVLHPATVLPAVEKNIPVLVLNSRNPSNEGTRILGRTPRSHSMFKAIAAKGRITVVEIVAARMLMAHGFLAKVFEIFARHRCAVDVVSTSEVSISLTVDSNEAIPQIAADLEKLAFVKYSGRKAIVCLVGENLRDTPGVAAAIFDAIRDINVRMISQGASEINLTFVVDEADVPEAVRRLHARFFTDVDPEVFD
jgi:aspartate kinase